MSLSTTLQESVSNAARPATHGQAKNTEAERRACEIRLRAEKKLGKLLKGIDRAQGKRSDLTSSQSGGKSFKISTACPPITLRNGNTGEEILAVYVNINGLSADHPSQPGTGEAGDSDTLHINGLSADHPSQH